MGILKKISCLMFVLIISCTKGKDNDIILNTQITLRGTVMHHDWTVGNIKVYIKSHATVYPGPVPSAYDTFVRTDPEGSFIFSNLSPGDYYFYAYGFDPHWGADVNGSLFLTLDAQAGEHKEMDTILNVSE